MEHSNSEEQSWDHTNVSTREHPTRAVSCMFNASNNEEEYEA